MKKGKAMAEAALFVGWGEPVRGREKEALEVFNESVEYWGRLQQEGRIEQFEVVFLYPHPGLGGFALLRGTAAQLDSARRDDEFERIITRVRLIVDGLELVNANVDEGIASRMAQYRDALKALG